MVTIGSRNLDIKKSVRRGNYVMIFTVGSTVVEVKNPSPEGPALVYPQRGSWIKTKGILGCWSIGVMEKAFPGI